MDTLSWLRANGIDTSLIPALGYGEVVGDDIRVETFARETGGQLIVDDRHRPVRFVTTVPMRVPFPR